MLKKIIFLFSAFVFILLSFLPVSAMQTVQYYKETFNSYPSSNWNFSNMSIIDGTAQTKIEEPNIFLDQSTASMMDYTPSSTSIMGQDFEILFDFKATQLANQARLLVTFINPMGQPTTIAYYLNSNGNTITYNPNKSAGVYKFAENTVYQIRIKINETNRVRLYINGKKISDFVMNQPVVLNRIYWQIENFTATIDNFIVNRLIGYRDPMTNAITDEDAKSVSINEKSPEMKIGQKLGLRAQVYPVNAANQKISWGSSDNTIATVDHNGVVTALKKGVAIIKCTTDDGGYMGYSTVTVKDEVWTAADETALKKNTSTINSVVSKKASVVGASSYKSSSTVLPGTTKENPMSDIDNSYKPMFFSVLAIVLMILIGGALYFRRMNKIRTVPDDEDEPDESISRDTAPIFSESAQFAPPVMQQQAVDDQEVVPVSVIHERIMEHLMKDSEIREKAKGDFEGFKKLYDDRMIDLMIEWMNDNKDFCTRYIKDLQFRAETDWLLLPRLKDRIEKE